MKLDASMSELSELIVRNATVKEEKIEVGKIYAEKELNGNKTISKQKIWERKLLDLSLRNNLLNLRMTKICYRSWM